MRGVEWKLERQHLRVLRTRGHPDTALWIECLDDVLLDMPHFLRSLLCGYQRRKPAW